MVRAARPGPVITWYLNRQAGNFEKNKIETTNNTDGTVDVTRYYYTALYLPREK